MVTAHVTMEEEAETVKEEKIAALLAALEECMLVMEEERMRKAKQQPTIASKCQVANALCKVLVLAAGVDPREQWGSLGWWWWLSG